MDPVAPTGHTARQLLALARRDRAAAEEAIAKLTPDAQVALICEAPLAERDRLLTLAPQPDALVAALPPAELCFTVKAIGLADAGWLLEHATSEQTVTAFDLDAWRGNEFDEASANEWLQAFAHTTPETRVRVLEAVDAEVVLLALRARIGVTQTPEESDGWSPPEGSQTLEGVFHFWALAEGDDLADVRALLIPLFESAYWTYFRLMQAAQWELTSDTEEWALRWRNGRLEDLGFPAWDEAMRIYRYLEPAQRGELPPDARPLDVEPWRLPAWIPSLPATGGPADRLFAAIAALDDSERLAGFFAFAGLANRVAVADRLPLGDADSTPTAIAKAARLASGGLAHLAAEHGLSDVEVLRRATLEHLFRLGANLDPQDARP